MATSSILKNVNIRGKKQIKAFVNALEKAENFEEKEVQYGRTFEKVAKEDIRKLFGDLNDQIYVNKALRFHRKAQSV